MFKYSSLAAVFVLTWAMFSPNPAWGRVWYSGSSSNGSYEMELMVNWVSRPIYNLGGHAYIEGLIGQRYTIRVHNHTWRRVEAVISVDGKDVLDGRSASMSKRGYIIPARSFIDVDGFRLNNYEVAAFRFTTVPDSYAARTGTPWNVGIIGVAFFPERVRRIPIRPRPPVVLRDKRGTSPGRWDEAEQSPSADGLSAGSRTMYKHKNLGTQFGERRSSVVDQTSFTRQNWSYPAARLSIRYDDRRGLCALGLGGFCYPDYPPYDPPPYYPPPQRDYDYAQPPPGWEHFSPWY